jgi:hypothetical protein
MSRLWSLALGAGSSVSLCSLTFSLFCVAVSPLQAATDGQTNEVSLSYHAPDLSLDAPSRFGSVIRQFGEQVTSSDDIVFDRFNGPASRLSWLRRQNRLGYGTLERINADGASMFTAIGFDGLRTVAAEVLPLELWEENSLHWFGNLISGTVGNPEEERIELTSISYSAVRTDWESGGKSADLKIGIRPWRMNPYVYLLAHAGHFEGKPLFTFESRAGYTMFRPAKLEGRLALQLPASFRIAAGASFIPAHLGASSASISHLGLTLERVLGVSQGNHESVFYVGFRSGTRTGSNPRHEDLFVAGLSRSW